MEHIHVPRDRLVTLMDDLAEKHLIYVHAPAGYGKTVSVYLWLKHSMIATDAKSAWLALDEYDNKPSVLCSRIVASLKKMQPENTLLHELAAHPAFDTEPIEFLFRTLDALTVDENRCVFILDDLHVIVNEEIKKALPALVKRLSQNLTVFLLSRTANSDIFSELVLKGSLSEVDTEQLRFSCDEIKMFFNSNDYKLTQKQAEDVFTSTGGWAFGLRALLLSRKPIGTKIAEEYLESFFKTQIWDKWDLRFKDFLIKISVVEEFTPDMCDALTDELCCNEMLDRLIREKVFFLENDTYRFHDLFREFLFKMLNQEGNEVVNKQYKRAGDWFFSKGNFYKSAFYYAKCGQYKDIARSFSAFNNYSSQNSNMGAYLSMFDFIALKDMPDEAFDENPELSVSLVAGYYLGGDAFNMFRAIDRLKAVFPAIKNRHPHLIEPFDFLLGLDCRQSLCGLGKKIQVSSRPNDKNAMVPTLTHNLPFFHRSHRDYSECLPNVDGNIKILRDSFGAFIGKEYGVIELCIRAGLFYEQGMVSKAIDSALAATAKIQDHYTSEIKFSSMMILASALQAGGQTVDTQRVLDDIDDMIEHDKAFYLNANLRALRYRLKLRDGDKEAAQKWLNDFGESWLYNLSFYKIYQHFTTARAHIVIGDYYVAILFIKKLLQLCEDYRRPLDIIEANILLAIAHWKKDWASQADALTLLERSIIMASNFGYTQMFANEGAELVSMLHKIQKRIEQKDYAGEIPYAFTKSLYIAAVAEAKRTKGLTGGKISEFISFTNQQKLVLRLMSKGYGRREIAENMGLTQNGVKSHIKVIYRKLDISNSVDAVIKARELRILDE